MESPSEEQIPDALSSDTNNATEIHPEDAPPHKQAQFRRFRAYNMGTWNGPKRENKSLKRNQDNLHRYDALASSLDLTPHQKARGRSVLADLDIRAIGIGVDPIIFAICVLVANADVDGGHRYWPRSDHPANDRIFRAVADDLGIGYNKQKSAITRVRRRTNLG